jgi:hypothetical protein
VQVVLTAKPAIQSSDSTTSASRTLAAEIGANNIGQLSRTGWAAPDSISQTQWLKVGKTLAVYRSVIQWALGDWWAYGADREYGDGPEIADAIGVNYQTIHNYASVCRAWKISRRRENLSFGHHEAVAALEESEQDRWLDLATRHKWSRNELRSQIVHEAIAAADNSSAPPALPDNPPAILNDSDNQPNEEDRFNDLDFSLGLECELVIHSHAAKLHLQELQKYQAELLAKTWPDELADIITAIGKLDIESALDVAKAAVELSDKLEGRLDKLSQDDAPSNGGAS